MPQSVIDSTNGSTTYFARQLNHWPPTLHIPYKRSLDPHKLTAIVKIFFLPLPQSRGDLLDTLKYKFRTSTVFMKELLKVSIKEYVP